MADEFVIRSLLLPELQFVKGWPQKDDRSLCLEAVKKSEMEVCPRCATPSRSVYDRRTVRLKDTPLRGNMVRLLIRKRRFSCKPCRRPFTEPVPGVLKGHRTTERYCRSLLKAAEQYVDLSRVRREFQCSSSFLYRTLYRHLELERRQRLYPWPKVIGIDEHFFRREKRHGGHDFVTMVVDFKGRRVMEVVRGKTHAQLHAGLSYIPGREQVERVALDLSDTYKSFAKEFFPNAQLVADKFHVLRLLNPHINRCRRELLPDQRSPFLRRMLLTRYDRLRPSERQALHQILNAHPQLHQLYATKEALSRFYRIRDPSKAKRVFSRICDVLAHTPWPPLKTFRSTLLKWRNEILAYFHGRLTNARTEGFNLKAKLVKRRAYGYRSFTNYRLRVLNACR